MTFGLQIPAWIVSIKCEYLLTKVSIKFQRALPQHPYPVLFSPDPRLSLESLSLGNQAKIMFFLLPLTISFLRSQTLVSAVLFLIFPCQAAGRIKRPCFSNSPIAYLSFPLPSLIVFRAAPSDLNIFRCACVDFLPFFWKCCFLGVCLVIFLFFKTQH